MTMSCTLELMQQSISIPFFSFRCLETDVSRTPHTDFYNDSRWNSIAILSMHFSGLDRAIGQSGRCMRLCMQKITFELGDLVVRRAGSYLTPSR